MEWNSKICNQARISVSNMDIQFAAGLQSGQFCGTDPFNLWDLKLTPDSIRTELNYWKPNGFQWTWNCLVSENTSECQNLKLKSEENKFPKGNWSEFQKIPLLLLLTPAIDWLFYGIQILQANLKIS